MNFAGISVLVVGDVMLDHYISGKAGRISPEAPVPVVEKRAAWTVPGGAANVALGLSRLGCKPALVGLIGEDAAGQTLQKQIAAEGIDTGLISSARRPTTCKTRILAQGQQLLRVDEEVVLAPNLEEETGLRKTAQSLVGTCQTVILSDYGKGVLLPSEKARDLCSFLIYEASEHNIPVLVDPKGLDWQKYSGAACITPNTREFIGVCAAQGLWQGRGEPGSRERQAMAEAICKRFDIARLLLTRGAKGMTLYVPGSPPVNFRAIMREVADVSGAGDTVIAILGACVAAGMPWQEGARLANIAAGVAVTRLGATPVSLADLQGASGRKSAKIMSWNELEERAHYWREAEQRIVFTNGCFDLLHPGHISLLRECAELGDRLVVGINTDASVKAIKGEDRPIQDEKSRAQVLAALECVDAVVLFDESTPENLIRVVRPDVLVKGCDYRLEEVAGADFVQSYGGQVHLAEFVDGCSTTELTRRIRGSK